MNHRNINATLRYYRIGEDRRRDAVDKVTAMAFDRHGNRIWRDVRDLLDAEHARYAISEVAVPYGRCTEPSNVQASGGACPVRFRCAGCDHFRTVRRALSSCLGQGWRAVTRLDLRVASDCVSRLASDGCI